MALKEDERFCDVNVLLMTPQQHPDTVKQLLNTGVTLTVGSMDHISLIQSVADKTDVSAQVHMKVDTGFGRFGFSYRNEAEILSAWKCRDKRVAITGIFTHYSCSFESRYNITKKQDERFDRILAFLKKNDPHGVDQLFVHSANSCGELQYSNPSCNAVRIGSAFLGRLPIKAPVALHRIAYLEASVLDVHCLHKGDNVAYGNTYTAKEDMQTAVIGIGYKDGYGIIKANDAFRWIDILRYLVADLKSWGKKRYLSQKSYEILGRIGLYCTIVKNDGTLHPNDMVRADCNPLFIDSKIPREYR